MAAQQRSQLARQQQTAGMSPLDIQEQMIAEQQRLQAVIIFLHLSIFLFLLKIAWSSLLLNGNEYDFFFVFFQNSASFRLFFNSSLRLALSLKVSLNRFVERHRSMGEDPHVVEKYWQSPHGEDGRERPYKIRANSLHHSVRFGCRQTKSVTALFSWCWLISLFDSNLDYTICHSLWYFYIVSLTYRKFLDMNTLHILAKSF